MQEALLEPQALIMKTTAQRNLARGNNLHHILSV